ncbi:hypothetical protein F4778DRAFT_4729 [Xylariomycetidae sp. FL2044]|nr:hypothetical protein F4778DRAFT_4729 [Xylariomycetidae sp. FL2044]
MADSSDSKPIPIILCGKSLEIGAQVVEGLKPEVEVLLFCQGADATAASAPYVLQGKAPPPPSSPECSSTLGTGNFSASRPPLAIVFGSAWSAEDVAGVRAAIRGLPGADAVLMLRHDLSRPSPPLGTPAYAQAVMARTKECLGRIAKGEAVEGPEEGVVWY